MGLADIPLEEERGLVPFRCMDPPLEVRVHPRYLEPPWLRNRQLVFALEGYGRFRLVVERPPSGSSQPIP